MFVFVRLKTLQDSFSTSNWLTQEKKTTDKSLVNKEMDSDYCYTDIVLFFTRDINDYYESKSISQTQLLWK